jgi:hypothetical protein
MGGAVSGSGGLSGDLLSFFSCSACWRPLFYLVCGDGEEGVGEHGEGDVSVPCVPGADLVVVESDFILSGSETFFDGPARSGYVDEFSESRAVWVVAVVEGEFAVVDGSADHVLVVRVGGVYLEPHPRGSRSGSPPGWPPVVASLSKPS